MNIEALRLKLDTVLSNAVENGDDTAYVSDHYPVIAEFEIGN